MKIIRHVPRRRRPILSEADLANVHLRPPKPKKRALLVGINYLKESSAKENANGDNAKMGDLKGSHKDVREMRDLLIDKYNYSPTDIVTLVDDCDPKSRLSQPTKANLLREMESLVKGARAGDHFFFHYSGHVVQGDEDPESKEEDKREEYIVPCDAFKPSPNGEDLVDPKDCIQDDRLREILVNGIPTGAKLVAVFDSCHSASLLDLEHFRCNRVYVPWTSKGRRKSESMWNNVERKQALFRTRTIIQTTRGNDGRVKERKTSVEKLHFKPTLPSIPSRLPSLSVSQTSMADTSSSQFPSSSQTPTTPTTSAVKSRKLAILSPIRTTFLPHHHLPHVPPQEEPLVPTVLNTPITTSPTLSPSGTVNTMRTSNTVSFRTSLKMSHKTKTQATVSPTTATITKTMTTKMTKRESLATIKKEHTQFIPWLTGVVNPCNTVDLLRELKSASAGTREDKENEKDGERQTSIAGDYLVESPIQDYCTGWCREDLEKAKAKPRGSINGIFWGGMYEGQGEVISLSSCKDDQTTWEDGDGNSMTQVLIRTLRRDTHPTFKDLMTTISHELHRAAVDMHQQTKEYKKKCVEWRKNKERKWKMNKKGSRRTKKSREGKGEKNPKKETGKRAVKRGKGDTDGLEMNNFQNPELSSRMPLNMNDPWNM